MTNLSKFLVGILLCATTLGCSVNVGMRKADQLQEVVVSQPKEEESDDKILLLAVDGMISFEPQGSFLSKEPSLVANLREQLDKAREDSKIKGVILRINSPGGTLGATQMIYDDLQRFHKETGIYILGLYLEVAASGALYLSMAANHVMAYPSALTGSLGVIFVSPNFQELGGKVGVEYRVVKSGAKKDMGTPFRSWPAEERKMLDELATSYNEQFKNVVFSQRKTHGMTPEYFETLTDGRIVSAEQALKLRLIDELGNMGDAISHLERKNGRGRMKVVAYTRYPDEVRTPYSRTYGLATTMPAPTAMNSVGPVAEEVVRTLVQGPGMRRGLEKGFYYLW